MVSLLGKSRTNKQISVLRSFARPQADGKLKNTFQQKVKPTKKKFFGNTVHSFNWPLLYDIAWKRGNQKTH